MSLSYRPARSITASEFHTLLATEAWNLVREIVNNHLIPANGAPVTLSHLDLQTSMWNHLADDLPLGGLGSCGTADLIIYRALLTFLPKLSVSVEFSTPTDRIRHSGFATAGTYTLQPHRALSPLFPNEHPIDALRRRSPSRLTKATTSSPTEAGAK